MADREKLIELIAPVLRCLPWGQVSSHTAGDIADSLIATGVVISNSETTTKWIPVTERLPENDQWALCFMKDNSFGTFRVFQWNYIDWQWNDRNEWYDEKDVTHWMPLPEPPKGE